MTSNPEAARGSARSGPSTLERALQNIVHIYHESSIRDNKDDLLSLKDLKHLLKTQAPGFLSVCGRNRPRYIEELFTEADTDEDKQLTFEEFTVIVGKVTDDVHRLSHGDDRCGPDRD
ncbi:protein S100-A15A-like [Emydura macquarii macquarii]|uniref:protein S100-A15A-like n=1 Tax=Emydura macquarii macquarii TaxID=1129001 RepID=UPI00352A0BB3